MYVKQLNAYTVAQLKEELANRNLETTGKKAELVVRLAGYLEEHVDDEMVEALALGELPKKGTPTKSAKDMDTSEVAEDEESELNVTNGDADTSADAGKEDDAKIKSEDEKEEEMDEEDNPEEKEDSNAKSGKDESVEETKQNGDTEGEQSVEEAIGDSSDLKVLDEVGPDDDDDTKKDEQKKKKKRRPMLSWPRLDELLQERRLALKLRTIVIGPVEISDLDNEIIRQIATEAESFHYKTTTIKNTETTKGIINACLKDQEACESFVEKLSGFRDNVRVEQCGFNMSQEKFFREVTKEDEEDVGPKPERMEYRTAIIRNLPEDPDEDKLKELFPDAPNIHTVRDQDGKCKGWAYVEFTTSKEGQEFIDSYRSKKDEERPKMDDETLRVGTLQHIGRLYLDLKKKDDKEKEEPKERPEGLLSDEERIRKPQLVRMWKQRLQNLEPLKKTRPEYYERQKKALEENIAKAEKAIEEDDAKRKEHGIPIPEAKKEAEKKKEEKKDRKEVRPMKRKAIPGRSMYRPERERRDYGRRSGMGSMTREQWQQNRSNWSGGSGVQSQAATANAVNLLVGLSKIFSGNQQQTGGSSYSRYESLSGMSGGSSMGGYSGGSSTWNSSGSGGGSIWGSGGSGGYSGGYSSSSGPSSKRRRSMPQGRSGGMRQEQLDQMRQGRR